MLQATFFGWYPHEPNDVGLVVSEDCVVANKRKDRQWMDVSCNWRFYAACQKGEKTNLKF